MSPANPKVDPYFSKPGPWQAELELLRGILLGCDLTEELKWGKPTYTFGGSNIILIMPLKESCALLFLKGALLEDPQGLLVQPGENSQSARQMHFTSAAEVTKLKAAVKRYVKQAIAVEEAGLKVQFKKSTDLVYPPEFQSRLDKNSALREAFHALTPGRQRQYHIYFTGAKKAETREARVEKALPLILDGMGLNDR
ncbi:YdeI/OmpD-associated family protein [Variovorax sp. GB1P17]|uniref:YdeI/OmpD-associated family protein n=1 Tax=Variovorax sp. GB1P17 TaxID=3443740 RepID=UPI003F48D2CC